MSMSAYRHRSPSPLLFSSSDGESEAESLALTLSPDSGSEFECLHLASHPVQFSSKEEDEQSRELEMETSDVEAWMALAASASSPASSLADISMKSISSSEHSDPELDAFVRKVAQSPVRRKRKRRKVETSESSDFDSADEADHETEQVVNALSHRQRHLGKRPRRGTLEKEGENAEVELALGVDKVSSSSKAISRYGPIAGRKFATNRRVARKVTVTGITEGVETLGPFIAARPSFSSSPDPEAIQVEASVHLQRAPLSPSTSTSAPPSPPSSGLPVARRLFQDEPADMLATCSSHPALPRHGPLGASYIPNRTRLKTTRRRARQLFNAHAFTAADPFLICPVEPAEQTQSMESILEEHAKPTAPSNASFAKSVHANALDDDLADEIETDRELYVESRVVKKARTRYGRTAPLLRREIFSSSDELEFALRGRQVRKDKARTAATSHLQRSSPSSILPARSASEWARIRAGYKKLRALAAPRLRHSLKSNERPVPGFVFSARSVQVRAATVTRRSMLAAVKDLGKERWEQRVGSWAYCDVVRNESWTDWPWVMQRKWTINDALVPEFRQYAPAAAFPMSNGATTRPAEEAIDQRPAKRQVSDPTPTPRPSIPAAAVTLRAQAANRRTQRERLRRIREDATRRRVEQEEAERMARQAEVRRLAEAAVEIERDSALERARRVPSPPPAYVAPIPIRAVQPHVYRPPAYLPNRYTRFTPSPPPPYNALTDRDVQIPARFLADGQADQAMESWLETVPAIVGGWPARDAVVRHLEAEAEAEVEIQAGPSRARAHSPDPFEMYNAPLVNGWNDALELEEGELALSQEEHDDVAEAALVLEMEDREREHAQARGLLSRVRGWLSRW